MPGQAVTLQAGELPLTLDEALRVTGLNVSGKALQVTPGPLVYLSEVEKREYVPGKPTAGTLGTGLNLDFPDTNTSATLTVTNRTGALHFVIDLQGRDLPARGMLLRFSIPVDAIGWQWYSDMQTTSPIVADKVFENVVPLRAYADLPEWKDKPALRLGYVNRNFCTVISGEAGLALAVPLDKPAHFRTAYDGSARRLDITYDFALSPDTRKPNAVSFAFDLYPCDPSWGMRSALQRYYRMYPDMFKVYVPRQGQWMAFDRLSQIDNANEFLFALQEGAPEPEYDDQIDVLSMIYYTHAGMSGNLPPPYNPEKDPLPPYEDQVAAVEKSFKAATGLDGLYEKVGTRKPDGKLAVEKWSVYGHLLAQFDLDPELPWGDYLLKNTITRTEQIKKDRGGNLDGFYYDGLTSGLDYATEHFKTAEAPLLWDPANKQPFLNNFFSSVKFARSTAELLRPRGQVTMMNGALGDSFYVIPWLDVCGAETGLRIARQDFNYIRTVIYHKPFLTLLKGNYEKGIGHSEVELFMKRCLAYGVYPGFFDWSPSGLGPGGRYWEHPRYYERDRDLFRKYEPLCRTLALAGWEPVTGARSSDPAVYVERYGPDERGTVWLTVLNEESRAHSTTLTIDAKGLGLDVKTVRAQDLVSETTLPLKVTGNVLSLDLQVPPDGVYAIQLATPQATAAWRLASSSEVLDRGQQMRTVDGDKPLLAVHWHGSGEGYSQEMVNGTHHIVLKGGANHSLHQWAMLFQNTAEPLKLKVRAAADNLDPQGNVAIRCNLAWVTPNYTYYKKMDFDLPGGTYDFKDFEFEIKPEQALRALDITPSVGAKARGTLRIVSVSLTDPSGREYLTDPTFSQWYEPCPPTLRQPVETRITQLRQSLAALDKLTGQLTSTSMQNRLGECWAQIHQLEKLIAAAQAENGCRRVLRDLDTVKQHLGQVALLAYGFPAPRLEGPEVAAPGDAVRLTLTIPQIAGLPVRTQLQAEGLRVVSQPGGGTVVIPTTAQPGEAYLVRGELLLGQPGQETSITVTHTIQIREPLQLTLKSEGFDPETGAARLRLTVQNNHLRPVTTAFRFAIPTGWQASDPGGLQVPAGGSTSTETSLTPLGKPTAGSIEVTVSATAGADTVQAREMLLYIPREATLLKNPGFEQGLEPWGKEGGAYAIDTQVKRSGQASARLENTGRTDLHLSQGTDLRQTEPCAVLLQASSRAENVESQPDRGYSLYVDIYYMDGSTLYGQIVPFQTGTTDWQLGELYIEPSKPIRNVNINLLLRGKSGKVWFDDIALIEDPGRKGNLAREAKVTVDSNYTGYNASPINDGIIRGNPEDWAKAAWASADDTKPHFIELQFAQPMTIARATIYWSLDAGLARTSQEVLVQVPEGEGWRTVATMHADRPVPQSEIRLDQPVRTNRVRLLQPENKGPQSRPGLMWVREVEVFGQ